MSKDRDRAEKIMEIRRYSNRRLYDVTHSRHVTLDEVYDRVKQGWRVRVTDATTGEDITARVLTQLIMELDQSKLAAFPSELLHRIIRTNESFIGDFMQNYFSRAFEMFQNSRRQFDDHIRRSMEFAAPPSTSVDWLRSAWGGVDPGSAAPSEESASAGSSSATGPDLQRKMEELNQEMESMRKEISRLRKPPRGKGSTKKKPCS